MLKKLLTLIICLLFLSSIADAWKAGYGYRKKITIQGGNLDANQTHFPVLIYKVDADIDDHCDDDGDRSYDILFTQSDDTTLDVDWIDYSEAGGNATIIAYVSDAGWTIESDGSTEIYLYYGNAAAGDPGTDAGVWDANFKGVWHLIESGNGSDDEFNDSTSNANHGTGGGAKGSGDNGKTPDQIAGKIYKGQDYTRGNDDQIVVLDDATLDVGTNTDFTISQWVYFNNASGDAGIGTKRSNAGDLAGWIIFRDTSDIWGYVDWGAGIQTRTSAVAQTTWYHHTFTADRNGNLVQYLDGSPGAPLAVAGNDDLDNASNFFIGYNPGDAGNYLSHDGILEEFRFSTTLRSAAWIKFEEANVDEGDNELTWGAEEEAPSDGFVPKVIIIR